jgi:pyruvate/2-oxoglutarate dehydrogenase complex dihydrolipoamide dehydrogenase (E3) component
MKKYETVVIGAGPGGYEAALKLADAGIKAGPV